MFDREINLSLTDRIHRCSIKTNSVYNVGKKKKLKRNVHTDKEVEQQKVERQRGNK